MNRQAWRDFLITTFLLGLALVIALLSSVAAERQQGLQAAVAAAISLLLALLGAIYIIPRLARNIRIEFLRFAVRTSVTVEGLIFVIFLAVIAFSAWNAGNNLLYLVFSAMTAFLIAANLIARLSLADVAVQLRFPDHIFATEPARITVTVSNDKRLMPSYSLLVEAVADQLDTRAGSDDTEEDGESPRRRGAKPGPRQRRAQNSGAELKNQVGKLAYFVLAPPRSSARSKTDHTFDHRGRYPITGFKLSTRFPAGFFTKWRRIDAAGEIIVYPRPRPVDDFYHALPMLAGQIKSHARGSGDDLYGIRRYQPVDHMRNIDWKATAKAGDIMVREHMREDEWRLTIVFDTARPDGAAVNRARVSTAEDPDGFDQRFEQAVELAASLANHFILEQSDVELITPAADHSVPAGSGNDHLYKILRSLATIQPTASADEKAAREKTSFWKWSLARFGRREDVAAADDMDVSVKGASKGGTAWRLLDELPELGNERSFKVLITSAAKGTIPAGIWRSAHVVFMEDLQV